MVALARLPDSASRRVDGDGGTRPLKRHGFPLAVAICALIGLAPRLWIALRQAIEYDGWWHVFISRQPWGMPFFTEVFSTAHPPVFFIALQISQAVFGYSRFAYRFVSLAAAVACIPLLAIITRRLGYSRRAAATAALLFALSEAATTIACEVRGYSLAVLLMLLAFYFFIARRTTLCIVTCGALVATHYFGLMFIVVLAILWRRKPDLADAIAAALVACGIAALWYVQVRRFTNLNHLPQFYLQPGQSVIAFLRDNAIHFVDLFSPFRIAALAVVILIVWKRSLPALVALLVFAGMVSGSLIGVYPFGGDLRQQFFFFPFLILALVAAADRLPAKSAVMSAIALLAIVNAAIWIRDFPIQSEELFTQEYRAVAKDRVVALDQFNTIAFFIHTHDRTWRLVREHPLDRTLEYAVSPDIHVLRDRGTWNYDVSSPAAIVRLRHVAQVCGVKKLTLFAIELPPLRQGPVAVRLDFTR